MVGQEIHAAARRTPCRVVLGIGLANLLAGLLLGASDWLPTFVALDTVYANFAFFLWIVAVYLGGQPPLARFGRGVAAKVLAMAIIVAAMLTAAGAVSVAVQLWHGTALDLPLYVAGLYANLGVSTIHLALLAVATRAILDRKRLSMGVTAIVWIATNLGFEHPLLRFGAPVIPASGMNGYGPFLAPQVAVGIYWTGFSIVLLAAGRWATGWQSRQGGGPALRSLGPNVFAVVWTAAVAWAVSGGWIFHNANPGARVEGVGNSPLGSDPPQPDYARLDLDIVISPLEQFLASRGTAVVVNRHVTPIPDLHFGIPTALEVVTLTTTGEFEGVDATAGCHRYRLNRPLEPKETLRIEFHLRWTNDLFAVRREPPRVVINGTFLTTTNVVPALGCDRPHPLRTAPPVAYNARLSTSLDQVAVTAGALVRAWKENGWSFFEYEAAEPVSPFTTIHSGHYAIRREVRDDRLFEVFYHPKHRRNTDRMIDAARAALGKRSKPGASQGTVRIVEVPDYQPFRRLGFLGICVAAIRTGWVCRVPGGAGRKSRRGQAQVPPLRAASAEWPVFETTGLVLPYSERGYPLSTPPPSESTPPRA